MTQLYFIASKNLNYDYTLLMYFSCFGEIMFSETVCEKIGNYVYRLIDIRNGETFYVGKGKGNRVFQHANEELKLTKTLDDEDLLLDDSESLKLDRIRQIRKSGLEVQHIIHRHGISDDSIFEVEAALIDAYAGLTNISRGHYSSDRGPMDSKEIEQKYNLPELEESPKHKLLLINVNNFSNESSRSTLLDQVRFAWRISKPKAEKAEFVLAVVRGVVKGAFVADTWLPASAENFPTFNTSTVNKSRFGFNGSEAPKDIQDLYVGKHGKRIVNKEMRHVQNPIRYWKIK